jgi:hypothetical protein
MDIGDTIAPNSDQLDAVDLLTGPRTFTITKVGPGSAEQPVDITLAEFPRVWRPGKSMRRVLVACWGPDAAQYVGRRLTLYCDPTVRFGGQEIGGTRISHLSHLEKRKNIPLLVSRGKAAMYVVERLDRPVEPPVEVDWDAEITAAEQAEDSGRLLELWNIAKERRNVQRAEQITEAGFRVRDRLAATTEEETDSE